LFIYLDESGDLIEGFDSKDLVRCWTWIYLSQLLGEDLTKDRHYAINPDGSEYDDDVGDPAEVGGTELIPELFNH